MIDTIWVVATYVVIGSSATFRDWTVYDNKTMAESYAYMVAQEKNRKAEILKYTKEDAFKSSGRFAVR